MRSSFLSVAVLTMLLTGCGKSKEKDTAPTPPPAVKPAAHDHASPAPAGEAPPPPVTATVATAPIPPSDDPVINTMQQAVEAFKARNNRLPVSVQEMADQKLLTNVPKAPAGKMYHVDQYSGQVRLTSDP